MNTAIVWVLTFTVLGSPPEYGEIAKYKTKEECMQGIEQTRENYRLKKKQIVASCNKVVK